MSSRADGEMRVALQTVLDDHFGVTRNIVSLSRRPFAYRTSFPIEELQVDLEGGESLQLLVKDLNRERLMPSARDAKPDFLHDPLREIEVYRSILRPAGLGAVCYGASVDARSQRYWLFLERVDGRELYQVGEFDLWQATARWLAGFHARPVPSAEDSDLSGRLLQYDGRFLRNWIQRALAFHSENARELAQLADHYDRVIDHLLAQPAAFIHGEFYASNIIVQQTAAGVRICPIDWEMAAIGPGLIDLAALTAGKWTDRERAALVDSYRNELAATEAAAGRPESFWECLSYCRLHLAVQWLGWSPAWLPPPEHRHDWLGEALKLAEALNLI